MKRKEIKDISEISQADIDSAKSYFYDYILPNYMRNRTAGILHRKFHITEKENFKFYKKVKKVNSLYEAEIKEIYQIEEKSMIQ